MQAYDTNGALLINAAITKNLSVRTASTNDSPTSSDDVLLCSATLTVTLPAVASNGGMALFIKNIGGASVTVTVDANASELIDGKLTQELTTMDTMLIVCNSLAWYIL